MDGAGGLGGNSQPWETHRPRGARIASRPARPTSPQPSRHGGQGGPSRARPAPVRQRPPTPMAPSLRCLHTTYLPDSAITAYGHPKASTQASPAPKMASAGGWRRATADNALRVAHPAAVPRLFIFGDRRGHMNCWTPCLSASVEPFYFSAVQPCV